MKMICAGNMMFNSRRARLFDRLISVGAGGYGCDGYLVYPSGGLTTLDTDAPVNGVRPALWLKMKG